MLSKSYISISLNLMVVAFTSKLYAAMPIDLSKASHSDLTQAFHIIQPGMKSTLKPENDTLKVIKQRQDENHVTHTRVQQQYYGFRVVGGAGVIHSAQINRGLNKSKDLGRVTMNGKIYQQIEGDLGKPTVEFRKKAQLALESFKQQHKAQVLSEESVSPVIYVDKNNKAHWAYQVSLLVHYKDQIPKRPTAILDAKTYTIFVQWNDIKTVSSAIGLGFGGNYKTTKYEFGFNKPLLNITRDNRQGICYMENKGVKVVDMKHQRYALEKPMKFDCPLEDYGRKNAYWTGYQADGYDMENGAYSPANDALYAGEVIEGLYKDWFGLQALSQNGNPMKIVMRIHYGKGYENAFWDGKKMTFGDGGKFLYPLVSLGIGAHEVSHGFTEQHSNLAYFGQSGGINEAFSDMAAQAAEYYSEGKSSWVIGGEIMKGGSGHDVIRYMEQPSLDGKSIDSARDYADGLDVHFSSGVYNRLFYLLAHKPYWDTRQAFHVMVKANMDYWTRFTDFEEGGCGIINAARDLRYSVSSVQEALDDVGIDYQFCSNVSFVS